MAAVRLADLNPAIQHQVKELPKSDRQLFLRQWERRAKNPTTAIVLALFLGGVGGHHFYMGNVGLGFLYLIFVWTFIPAIVALVECLFLKGRVERYNEDEAEKVMEDIEMLEAD